MKLKLYTCLIIFSLALITFSCRNNDAEKKNIDEITLIKKLSENDFYKEFFNYNIRPREEGRIYMIGTDSIWEFWVNFDSEEGVTFSRGSEEFVEKKIKNIHPDDYMQIKNKYLLDVNKLINFMVNNEIRYAVNLEKKKLFFGLTNGAMLERDNIFMIATRIDSLKEFYDDIRVIDSNWVIFKNPKYESQKNK